MGLITFLDALFGALESGERLNFNCDTFELFELGETWKGTARVHGAGKHLETIKMNESTTLLYPREETSQYTRRGRLRKAFREWAGTTFSSFGSISKDMVVLNEGENCLTVEGFVKKSDGNWKLVSSASEATHYGAFKILVAKAKGDIIGHEELDYLFKADTLGRVTTVEVTEGF